MKIPVGGSTLRQAIIAGIATLTMAGALATPAEAFPIAATPATSLADAASPAVEGVIDQVYYRRYYRWHRWHPRYRYYGYRRFYRGGVPVPCRGRRTAMSKRYC